LRNSEFSIFGWESKSLILKSEFKLKEKLFTPTSSVDEFG
jgi:hypothetical protein